MKNTAGSLIGIALNLQIALGSILIVTILILPIHEHGIHTQLAASLVAQRLKSLPAMQETWVRSLGREDPLEKEMATHSSILAWRIPWMEEPGGL